MATTLNKVIVNLTKFSFQTRRSANGFVNFQPCYRWLHLSSTCQRVLDNRAYPPYKFPSHKKGKWDPRKPIHELYEYTVCPRPFPKTGGRGPNGRIWNHKRSGGHKRNFRMIDWVRGGPEGDQPLIEKVSGIFYDPNRSGRIAMVAAGTHKRWILATQNMKKGDLIKSSQKLTKTPVRAQEGDTYPLGSLPIGTLVNCVEMFPGTGGHFARAAGVQSQIVRKVEDKVVVRLPSKRELQVSAKCQATIGRVSNIDHNKRVIGKAGRNRWLGFHPNSGRWHRKTGRFGRKIRAIRPMLVRDAPKATSNPRIYVKPKDGVQLYVKFIPANFQV